MGRLRRHGTFAATIGILGCWLALDVGARAQGPVDAALLGLVEDQRGHPLWGAKITLRPEAGPDGRFLLAHVEPGTYVLAASSFGYVRGWLPGLRLVLGETAELELSLSGELDATAIDYGQNETGVPRANAQFDPKTIRYDKALSELNYPQVLHAMATWAGAAGWAADGRWRSS